MWQIRAQKSQLDYMVKVYRKDNLRSTEKIFKVPLFCFCMDVYPNKRAPYKQELT